ncbi:ribosome biogenesis regulatory protein [Holotrichia oblita]|uniref:Ribosome biogenesis regulatory protein n=1 Tax=Holotrichia oblita TaxID=644536 RepID=A0ACB9SRQ1_HOLOL|nr:ribosome biogenesis regulatory protein [Holotrichia oblita]
MDLVTEILENGLQEQGKFKTITVEKHLELDYDLGSLLCVDNNELDLCLMNKNKDDYLRNLTRDNVQLLLNKIWDLPTEKADEVIVAKLPRPTYVLPRAKHVPKPKPLTKWQEYAKLKGIQKKKKSKLSWDEQLKKWIPLYGYKRAEAARNKEWLLEVPQNADPMEDQFAKRTDAKTERVAKNELQRLRNIAKTKNIKVPRMGLLNPDVSTAKDLQAAVTVAKSSTASIGKFQGSLPKEKEARGVATITPGASSRKRKAAPVSSEAEKAENLLAIDFVLNKKPKIDVERAVNKQVNQQQLRKSEESTNSKPKAGGKGKKKGNSSSSSKKPKSGKGQRKGKNSGRKRR